MYICEFSFFWAQPGSTFLSLNSHPIFVTNDMRSLFVFESCTAVSLSGLTIRGWGAAVLANYNGAGFVAMRCTSVSVTACAFSDNQGMSKYCVWQCHKVQSIVVVFLCCHFMWPANKGGDIFVMSTATVPITTTLINSTFVNGFSISSGGSLNVDSKARISPNTNTVLISGCSVCLYIR